MKTKDIQVASQKEAGTPWLRHSNCLSDNQGRDLLMRTYNSAVVGRSMKEKIDNRFVSHDLLKLRGVDGLHCSASSMNT